MNHRRRGASIAELLVVMTACTVVLTLTSQMICRVMRIQIESRAQFDVERNALRLSEQFRGDVHRAEEATTDRTSLGEDVFLQLEFSGEERVDYSWADGTVLRRVLREAKTVSREEFQFTPASKLSIEKTDLPQRLLLTLSTQLTPTPPSANRPHSVAPTTPVSLQVEALVGRDVGSATAPREEESSE